MRISAWQFKRLAAAAAELSAVYVDGEENPKNPEARALAKRIHKLELQAIDLINEVEVFTSEES